MTIARLSLVALVVLSACVGCDNRAAVAVSGHETPQAKDDCIRLVEDYVAKTRGWNASDYEIREESSDLGGRGFSVWHTSDSKRRPPGGGGKSFHLEVDGACRKAVKELAYQ